MAATEPRLTIQERGTSGSAARRSATVRASAARRGRNGSSALAFDFSVNVSRRCLNSGKRNSARFAARLRFRRSSGTIKPAHKAAAIAKNSTTRDQNTLGAENENWLAARTRAMVTRSAAVPRMAAPRVNEKMRRLRSSLRRYESNCRSGFIRPLSLGTDADCRLQIRR